MTDGKKSCTCLSDDARTCWELLHYGYSPVSRALELEDPGRRPTAWEELEALDEDAQVCECACHRDDDSEWSAEFWEE